MANGPMPSSLILGYSRCQKPSDWRANPDEETTDWRARRGRTAHRVRREGTVKAVPYPYSTFELSGRQRQDARPGPGGLPLALRLSEGLGVTGTRVGGALVCESTRL